MSHAHKQLIQRLFGPGAVLSGSMGSRLGHGSVTISIGGVVCGRGRTMAVAIRSAQRTLMAIGRRQRRSTVRQAAMTAR
jgi:hypothetical protein